MRMFCCCLLVVAATAMGQTGQQPGVCSGSTMSLNVGYTAGFCLLNANVTSVSIPNGNYGSRAYNLTIQQGAGGPYTVTGWPATVAGVVSVSTASFTYLRLAWDMPSQLWISSPQGQPGLQGVTGPKGDTGPTGPTGSTSVGTCSISQGPSLAISSGVRPVVSSCPAVVANGSYVIIETSSSLSAYPLYQLPGSAIGTAAGQLTVNLNGPALALGSSYTISFNVWRMN